MFDLFSFTRKKSESPLSSLKAATRWLDELPLGDMFAAQSQIVKNLNEFNNQGGGPFSKERLDILMHLNERSEEIQEGLCRQYLLNPRMAKAVESRLWNSIYSYYWELTRAYHAFVMDYISRPAGNPARAHIPLLTCRAMHYFAMGFKWRYFRYEAIDGKTWKRLHNLYRFAEFEKFETEPMDLFPGGEESQTSCASEYLRALMLGVLDLGSLFPRQIEMVDHWLSGWVATMQLEKEADVARHVFLVDFNRGGGARRLRNPGPEGSCRYWSTQALVGRIEEIRAALLNGETPARLGLGENCRLPGCLDFLDEVARQWAPTVQRARRRHARTRSVKMIEVTHGFQGICEQVKRDNEVAALKKAGQDKAGLSYDEMVDVHLYGFVTQRTQVKLGAREHDENPADEYPREERWLAEDESAGGFGATMEIAGNDWLRLGRLVGIRADRKGKWMVGVVRRLSKIGAVQYRVGLEVMGSTPVAVSLRAKQQHPSGYVVDGGPDAVDVMLPVAGIYIAKGENYSRNSVILETAEYASGRVFVIAAGTTAYSIRLGVVEEKGDDWLRAEFEVIERNVEPPAERVSG